MNITQFSFVYTGGYERSVVCNRKYLTFINKSNSDDFVRLLRIYWEVETHVHYENVRVTRLRLFTFSHSISYSFNESISTVWILKFPLLLPYWIYQISIHQSTLSLSLSNEILKLQLKHFIYNAILWNMMYRRKISEFKALDHLTKLWGTKNPT